ncbi:MAG: GntR family transcriptional regulator [Peptostreptococcaceae bacterium]|uniref:GntR family transcriptional regulator n=1 Tax=Criibacterium bergeronii TaxID=1871336 RepID=A0A371INZ9_9FIRM|nr:GntR family transcriptional regulator [Criibacterium bergeronii]MBS6062415.1 GntR family transcriptional regulator [Peptostreptococcaceae bacterium]RDY22166.1 GntR family transcriptional regulator [Criibacterium bergeronii]
MIRNKIIQCEYKEGDLITENSVAEDLDMSRTPVKKAFVRLKMENYLKSFDGVGTIVKGLSIKELSDMYEARILIETYAMKTSINEVNKDTLLNIRNKFTNNLSKYGAGDKKALKNFAVVDKEFHNIILDKSQNEYLKKCLSKSTLKSKGTDMRLI